MAIMTTTQMLTGIRDWVLGKLSNITSLIPSQASAQNQLADKAFVNSSIATATATFRGTYNLVSDLSLTTSATHAQTASALASKMTALSITPDANDYAFVQVPAADDTPTVIARVDRYKFNGTAWAYEYSLNNSGFTAEQWAAINSGATLELIGKLSALPTNAQLTELLNGKVSLVDNGAYDVSANNGGITFASLSALLSSQNLSTLIPTAVRQPGMSIKFIQGTSQSSDNKYVQYRLTNQSWSIDVDDWQEIGSAEFSTGEKVSEVGIDDEPTAGSSDLITSGEVFKIKKGVDTIDNILCIEKETESKWVIIDDITINGGAISSDGRIIGVNPLYSPLRYVIISLSTGDKIRINGYSDSDRGRYGKYISNSDVQNIVMGESDGSNVFEYETIYEAQSDIDLVIGFNNNYFFSLEKYVTVTKESSKIDSLDEVIDILDVNIVQRQSVVPLDITDIDTEGYWIGKNNAGKPTSFRNYNGFKATDFFFLKKGDVINLSVSGGNANIAILVVKDIYVDGVVRVVIPSNGSAQEVTYTVPNDGEYSISRPASATYRIIVTRNTSSYSSDTIDGLTERVSTLENSISRIGDSVEDIESSVEDIQGQLTTVVEDDMTTGYEDGAFVNTNGTINYNSNFGYKEFDVKAGANISGHVYTHGTIAILAKKLTSTTYLTLINDPQGFRDFEFSYEATEDMTIAISFENTKERSIKIETNIIESHSANIDNLLMFKSDIVNSISIQDMCLGFLFDKIAVIGDSMAVATMDGYNPPLGASWLSFLGKRWRCTGEEWYAKGGTSSYSWLNDTEYGLGKLLADTNIYNAYFIAYGHNDGSSVGEATDEAAPVTITDNVPSCPSGYSFCAYYKAIINQIRTKAPHAMIFCLSQYDYAMTGWHSQYGEAVIDIAEWYYENGDKLVHHLDTGGVPISDMEIGGHYSTVGYAYIASKINEEANKVIYQYRADEEIKSFGVYNL